MTQIRHAAPDASQAILVKAPARHRRDARAQNDPFRRSSALHVDIDELLLDSAELVLTQLRVLRTLAASASDAHRIVLEVHENAVAQGIAPAGAIGVTAVLADLLCRPDEHELAEMLHRARCAFSDDELINGAAAMLAATSAQIGRLEGLEPALVADEVARHRRFAG